MPTIEQIRAARALLDWSQSDLADHAGLSQTGIARIENGTNQPNSRTIEKILAAFSNADIEFLEDSGVRKKTGEVRVLKGVEGLKSFIDEVYAHAKSKGGDFCLHNADPDNWYKWLGKEWFEMHADRMSELEDYKFKITCAEGMTNFISNSFAEYRWLPKDQFSDQSIYAFGDTLAFVNFGAEQLNINILKNKEFTKGFQVLFNVTWDSVAQKISNN